MTTNSILDFIKSSQKVLNSNDNSKVSLKISDNSGFSSILDMAVKTNTKQEAVKPEKTDKTNYQKAAIRASHKAASVKKAYIDNDTNQQVQNNKNDTNEKKDISRIVNTASKKNDASSDMEQMNDNKQNVTEKADIAQTDSKVDDQKSVGSNEDTDTKAQNITDDSKKNSEEQVDKLFEQIAAMMGITPAQLKDVIKQFNESQNSTSSDKKFDLMTALTGLDEKSKSQVMKTLDVISKLLQSVEENGDSLNEQQIPAAFQQVLKAIETKSTTGESNLKGISGDDLTMKADNMSQLNLAATLSETGRIIKENLPKSEMENLDVKGDQNMVTATPQIAPVVEAKSNEIKESTETKEAVNTKADAVIIKENQVNVDVETGDGQSQNAFNKNENNADIFNVKSTEDVVKPKAADFKLETVEGSKNVAEGLEKLPNTQSQQSISKASSIEVATKAEKAVNVKPQEVINQIVEKAKFTVTPEKSEMVLELKPESLGKISLKVATERGIVVASFVAENQQVKDIIESNMQLLKDSLEKQGLMVQSFSVSVGNGNAQGSNGKEQAKNYSNQQQRITTVQSINAFESTSGQLRSNQATANGLWGESSINLTA